MKRILALLFIIAAPAFAFQSVRVDTSVNNLATTYNGTFPQLAIQNVPRVQKSISAYNGTAGEIALQIFYAYTKGTVPTSKEIYVPAGVGLTFDNVGAGGQIYLRSNSGSTITSGIIQIHSW